MTPNDFCTLLSRYQLPSTTEALLQSSIEQVLKDNGVAYQREVQLSAADRPDFMVDGWAVEVKIKGGASAALRQVSRYLALPMVKGVILVGTPAWVKQMPGTLHGKPLYALRLMPKLF